MQDACAVPASLEGRAAAAVEAVAAALRVEQHVVNDFDVAKHRVLIAVNSLLS